MTSLLNFENNITLVGFHIQYAVVSMDFTGVTQLFR